MLRTVWHTIDSFQQCRSIVSRQSQCGQPHPTCTWRMASMGMQALRQQLHRPLAPDEAANQSTAQVAVCLEGWRAGCLLHVHDLARSVLPVYAAGTDVDHEKSFSNVALL